VTEHPNDPTTPLPPAGLQPPGPNPTTDLVGLEQGRRRRRKLKVIVATAITGTLVTGATSYAVVASRSSAEEVATGVVPSSQLPSAGSGNDTSPFGGGRTLPQQPGLGGQGQNPFGGSLTGSSDTTAATSDQQVGVVAIYAQLADGSEAAGTGMVLTSDGEILTNNHVIEDSTKIKVVVVSTDRTYDATVVGTDKGDDVAVLQLSNATGLDTVTTDTSDPAAVGDDVTGVGNAGGDGGDPSAATGTVVGVDRHITVHSDSGSGKEHLSGLIAVDADIIAGDSGGPLYDSDTEVIGMNTAASSGTRNVTGYAIPISTALAIAADIEAGHTTGGIQLGYPAFLGVALARSTGSSDGAPIAGVERGSAAASAGLSYGDTITWFDGTRVTSGRQLARLVSGHQPDDQVRVSWVDNGGTRHSATVTLGEGPAI
jgi:S1-C subfamily serine protease